MPEKIIPWSVSRASWLLVKQEEKLTEDDKLALERMKQSDEEVAQAYTLGQRFAGMIRERQSESLLPWLEDVAKSGIGGLTGFAMHYSATSWTLLCILMLENADHSPLG